MDVVFLSKSLDLCAGGLLPVMQELASKLLVFDVDVTPLGLDSQNPSLFPSGWNKFEIQTFKSIGPMSIGYSPDLYSALVCENPDLLHTHGIFYYTSAIGHKWSRKCHKPYLCSPHGMLDPWALMNSKWKKKIASILFENKHLVGANCLHALCASETESIRRYGLKNNVCQIPNGIYIPDNYVKFDSPWNSSIPKGKKVLLYLSRIHPKKGLPILIETWHKVQRNLNSAQDWVLAIAGWDQGGHEDELKAQVNALGLQDSVIFLGPQFDNNKAACYQNASGFILPSFSEGLPMVVLEAWAHGLPVLMTAQCNIPEGFLANAAIQIKPESQSIEEGLRDFFSLSDQERNQLGLNGLELVKDKFTWDKVAEDMYSVYEWTLGGGAPPSCVVTD